MAAKNKVKKAGNAAQAARENQYLQRLLQDQELRDNIVSAYGSARNAYGRLNNGKAPVKALLDDKKLQRELREAADSLRAAGEALGEGPKKKRRSGGIGGLLVLVLVGAVLAVAVSEDLRSKLLDALFGSEEEFDYSSTTASRAPAPDPIAAT